MKTKSSHIGVKRKFDNGDDAILHALTPPPPKSFIQSTSRYAHPHPQPPSPSAIRNVQPSMQSIQVEKGVNMNDAKEEERRKKKEKKKK
ncbi:hypothetical protein GE21DRAFT_1068566 [Neurospora crassa]|nr:hypothetical protein GE21DRAFT_1068566 [Neurospora crassa]